MMDPDFYRTTLDLAPLSGKMGGPELLIPEILSLFHGRCSRVYLPFPQTGTLAHELEKQGIGVHVGHDHILQPHESAPLPRDCDGIYFGTPTIVDNAPLWKDEVPYSWTADQERSYVRSITQRSEDIGVSLIVSGLGLGDITLEERITDMGGAFLVCYKAFEGFADWLLAKELT
jgi:hypothetical protein